MSEVLGILGPVGFKAMSKRRRRMLSGAVPASIAPVPPEIGGILVGTQGTTGIYSGYTMMGGGDDFNENSPQVINGSTPNAKYWPTHYYDPGARDVTSGVLIDCFDMDPYFTGAQDSNRGVAVGSTNMNQASSILTLQTRIASGAEPLNINGKPVIGAMIGSIGYVTAVPPFIVEARVKLSANNPQGWHTDFWINSVIIPGNTTPAAPGAVDFNFEQATDTSISFSSNVYGAASGLTSFNSGVLPIYDNQWHILSFVVTGTTTKFYADGVLVFTRNENALTVNKPYQVFFTAHTYDPLFNLTSWQTSGAVGASMQVDWYRTWIPNASISQITNPLVQLPTLKADYNTTFTYTFPTPTALWGTALTDFPQALKLEDFEPGSSSEGTSNYTQFPTGLAFNATTRVLSGKTSDMKPGRMHTLCVPYVANGSIGYTARGYVDIGPNITTTSASILGIAGSAMSYDLYYDCDVGTLLPKVLTVSGLPTGLSFSPSTGLITGTPSASGTTAITIGVTNSSGQTASKTVNLVVNANSIPVIESSASSNIGNTTPAPVVHLSTHYANEPVFVLVSTLGTGGAASVASISDTYGLTWTKYTSLAWGASSDNSLEVWRAVAPTALFRNLITINLTGATSYVTDVEAFGVPQANTSTPFDPNGSLPAQSQDVDATQNISETISTTSTNSLLINLLSTTGAFGTVTRPVGFAQILNTGSTTNRMEFMTVSSPQTSLVLTYSWTGTTSARAMVSFAIQGA